MNECSRDPEPHAGIVNIILWNLTPYLGVLFLHWEPLTVFVCYALETIVICIFNVFKLVAVYYYGMAETGDQGPGDMGLFAIPAFFGTFGLWAYFQLVMFFAFAGLVRQDSEENTLLYSIGLVMDNKTLYLALTIFIVSNAYSFVNDFILPGTYTRVTMSEQMAEPFPRVVLAQIVVIFAVFVYNALDNSIIILLIMTPVKIFIELYMRKHKAAELLGWD